MTAPTTRPILILLGLRGAGKSAVGPILAQRTARPFVDLDPRTAAELGVASPADALRQLGEPAFRAAEARALAAALTEGPMILALGGGTPMFEPAAGRLRAAQHARHAALLYLRAQPDALRRRLLGTDLLTRPALLGHSPLDEIDALFALRDPVYQALADLTIATDGLTPAEVADHLTPPSC